MTKKIKYLYVAYRLFEDIIRIKPTMTGCYQWLEVFKGDAKNYAKLTDSDLEKYDVIMVNLDGQDCRMVPALRHRLKSSSTQIVVNQDYAPEGMMQGFALMDDLLNALRFSDRVFATSPLGQNVLQNLMNLVSREKGSLRKVYLIPHPVETKTIKRIKSFITNDWLVIPFHRYQGDAMIPWIVAENSGLNYGLIGHYQAGDKWFKRHASMFKTRISYVPFPDMIKIIKEAKYGLFIPNSFTYGRIPLDFACSNTPLVVSETIYSARICYPLTIVNPYDVQGAVRLLKELQSNHLFYQEVCDLAYYNVEFFNHKNSRERFIRMLENN